MDSGGSARSGDLWQSHHDIVRAVEFVVTIGILKKDKERIVVF